jgi:hypothetical protein
MPIHPPLKLSTRDENELYLTVLPLIHITLNQPLGLGLTEQVLTLYPERNFATEFFADEADEYISMFKHREKYLVGGHVKGYRYEKVPVQGKANRLVVKVIQIVGE